MKEWQFGLVIMVVVTSTKLHYAVHRARLVLRCLTIYRYTTSVCNQPLRLTQPPTLIGKGNKYWSRDSGSALRWEGSHRSGFAPAERHRIYRLNGLRQGDEQPTYTPVRCIALYYFWATVCKTVRPMLSVRCLSVLSVCPLCNVGVLWPNGWTDQDETWHAGSPRPWPHCVRWDRPSSPSPKGAQPPDFQPILVGAKWLHGSRCQVWS